MEVNHNFYGKFLTFKAYWIFVTARCGLQAPPRMVSILKNTSIAVKIVGFFQFYILFRLIALDTKKSPSPNFDML